MMAVNVGLQYLGPIISQMMQRGQSQGSGGGRVNPFIGILSAFLNQGSLGQNLNSLGNSLGSVQNTQKPSLAAFLPFLMQGLGGGKINFQNSNQQNPISAILTLALKDSNLFNQLKLPSQGSNDISKVLPFMQVLIQGFSGQQSPQLMTLFNSLLQGTQGGNPIDILKNLPQNSGQMAKFGQLLPYLEPLINGLNSGGDQQQALTEFLIPLLGQNNPASSILDLINVTKGGNSTDVASALFPALDEMMSEWVPGKQVFVTQLLQGLMNGNFRKIQVTRDLQAAPALLLSGQASDIFKLLNLPNVDRIIALRRPR